jgi:hypothetical protein
MLLQRTLQIDSVVVWDYSDHFWLKFEASIMAKAAHTQAAWAIIKQATRRPEVEWLA